MKPNLQYFALGDSLTKGLGAPTGSGFVEQYTDFAHRKLKRPVLSFNAGNNGETTKQILERVIHDKSLKHQLRAADLVTITAGGNDMLQAARQFLVHRDPQLLKSALKGCQQQYMSLLRTIHGLSSQKNPPTIRIIGLYNPFPQIEEAVFWVKHFNKMLDVLETDHVKVVHIYDRFEPYIDVLLWDDYIHPNAEGYRVIAEAAAEAGFGF